jgi:hypothetical protein
VQKFEESPPSVITPIEKEIIASSSSFKASAAADATSSGDANANANANATVPSPPPPILCAEVGSGRSFDDGNDNDEGPHLTRSKSFVQFSLPNWVNDDYFNKKYETDEDMMALAIHLSARNVAESTG